MHRRRALLLTGVATGGVVLVALLPMTPSGVTRNPEAHLAADVAGGCIAIIAAVLIGAQAARSSRLDQLLLALSMALFAFANFAFSALPIILDEDPATASAWAAVLCRLSATALLTAAARTSPERRRPEGHTAMRVLAAALALAAGLALLLLLTADALPRPVPYEALAADGRVDLDAVPALTIATCLGILLFAIGAAGFARKAARGDELASWLAAACIVAVGARTLYLVQPSLYSAWFSAGDGLRLAFYALVATGVATTVARNAATVAELAAVDAQRRVARDVHDTFAQELAALAFRARDLADGADRDRRPDAHALHELAATAQRALDQSRSVIRTLDHATTDTEPLVPALRRSVDEVARRWGVPVDLTASGVLELTPRHRRELELIVHEAITNAARHGAPTAISVRIRGGRRPVVRILDDGRGFDPDATRPNGYGLTTMRARAAEIGATVDVRSALGEGSTVEVRFR